MRDNIGEIRAKLLEKSARRFIKIKVWLLAMVKPAISAKLSVFSSPERAADWARQNGVFARMVWSDHLQSSSLRSSVCDLKAFLPSSLSLLHVRICSESKLGEFLVVGIETLVLEGSGASSGSLGLSGVELG